MPSLAVIAIAALVVALSGAVALLAHRGRRRPRAGVPAPGSEGTAPPGTPAALPRPPAAPFPVDAPFPADPTGPADAMTPGGVVNIARRSLVLLGRQLALVDSLERDELDPDTLETLYRLDHLATRMRRYAESLLVLAGEDVGRQARAPMPLSDVVRTATSGIEQYARIDVVCDEPREPDEEPAVHAHRALPLAHLLAELLENATAASDPATRVRVTTRRTGDGVRLTVSDEGLGMTDSEIDTAVAIVRRPGGEHAAGSTQLGLHVVGRLAHRLGASVGIRRGETGGLAVDVHVPAEVLMSGPAEDPGGAEAPPAPAAPVVPAGAPVALPVRPQLPRRRDIRRPAPAEPSDGGLAASAMPGFGPGAEPTAWIPFATSPVTGSPAVPPPAASPPVPAPVAPTVAAALAPVLSPVLSPAADILPAGRERRSRRWGSEAAPAARAVAAVLPPRARDLGGDLGRRSAVASEALSELSMLSSYRPEAAPTGASPLQPRRPAEVPPPVPPPILAPAPRDPAAVGGLLAGFAAGARRGRAGHDAAGVGPVPTPVPTPVPPTAPTAAAAGWRARPTIEEGP
ncbi:MAG: ATP-binding protein [Kineosporiaceae bacterium]